MRETHEAGMTAITMTDGRAVVVSPEDFERVSVWGWFPSKKRNKVYAAHCVGRVPNQTRIFMHRLIMGLGKGDKVQVDHINGDTLDNRRENLRIATHAENVRNAKRRSDNASGFKGVSATRQGKWLAQIKFNRKTRYLGTFAVAEDAARAYDKAARELHGEFAWTNFQN